MIAQRYRTISIKETESINKCLDIALVNDVPYIITGGVENKLYIYNFDLELLQEIKFNGWIRSCSVVDLDNDLNQELIIGSGDNTLRVFKYIDSQFEELWHYNFEKKVSGVGSGDINDDGRIEIIAGSWDKTLKVFDGQTGMFLWEISTSDWITVLKVLDVNWDGIPEIIIGLKKGQFGVINGFVGEYYWDFQFPKRCNDIDMAVIANNEFPHLFAGGDDCILYIFDRNGRKINEIPVPDRILAIAHGDINGNGFNEVIVSLGNKKLYVFEADISEDNIKSNHSSEVYNFKLRWQARLANVATNLKILNYPGDIVPKIVVTGYMKKIKIIEDFNYEKEPIKIEKSIKILATPSFHNYEDIIKELLGDKFNPEYLISNKLLQSSDIVNSIKELINPKLKKSYKFNNLNELLKIYMVKEEKEELIKPITAKIEEKEDISHLDQIIIDLLNKKGVLSKKKIIGELINSSHFEKEIEEKIVELKNNNIIKYSRTKPQGYSLNQEIHLPIIIESNENIINRKESEIIGIKSDEEEKILFIETLKSKEIVSSKAKLEELMKSAGIKEEKFISLFNSLKTEKKLVYSKSAPRGYSIAGENKIKMIEQPLIPDNKREEVIEKFQQSGTISSKAKLLELINDVGIERKIGEKIIDLLKAEGILKYSKSKPRGYSIIMKKE